ncbi:N-acetylhexosaminidase [Trametes versicolor FP-101664 SS1]|uniref:N-acetylhexosaminidase n=1 Tax=Trametes versicolor (strain FP-101664) TaxID=717944 RepID=UPI0004621815|nr:N-acetylhexosaminidase [Trametes versicolor FP-101664 SS1]EIW55410.1 N-acetylhexosaminidase [Trametes versicolor FP-101664 SS1]
MVPNLPLVLVLCFLFVQHASALWPIPSSLSSGTAAVKLSPSFAIHLDVAHPPADLLSAISRTRSRLHSDTFERLVLGRASADAQAIKKAHIVTSLTVGLRPGSPARSIAEETTKSLGDKDESYELSVPDEGPSATLVANSTLGLLRGLTTFEQLWYDSAGTKYMLDGPLRVADQPAFPYRGFSFDTSRNFYPVSDVLRTLDAMSWVKLSVLYWHIIDSQSFPLEVGAFPELSAKGAYSSKEVYSLDDIQQIIQYANERGIDVIMEMDSPGHTNAISAAHPEHIACAAKSPWATYASEPPAGQLRIASPATLAFARTLFASVAATLPGTMMSSGGDEVNLPCWAEDAETVAELARRGMTIGEALDEFVKGVQGVIREHGKTPFIKSDMVLTHNVPILNDTVVVVWQTSADAASVAARGLRMIHQPSNYFYLDCGAGEWIGNDVLGNSWCDPFKTWQRAYSFDPYANLTAEQHSLVLGGQMPLWSEQSSPENLDPIVWPRLAAGAEVFWTGATLPDGSSRFNANVTSSTQALARLNELRYRFVDRGVNAIALQPKWCVLRPGECDLDS